MRPDQIPNFHFLILAPNLGAEWLFDAARRYWERYEPTILNNLEIVGYLPPELSVNVTVIALRDTIAQIGVELAQIAPAAYLDAVVVERPEEAQAELNRRAETEQPFGVPLVAPTATINYTGPTIPTPRLPGTRPPNGFTTITPTPSGLPTDVPTWTPTPLTPSATPTDGPSPTPTNLPPPQLLPTATPGGPTPVAPILPTPGPLTGGG